jgi:hypothetical protein
MLSCIEQGWIVGSDRLKKFRLEAAEHNTKSAQGKSDFRGAEIRPFP